MTKLVVTLGTSLTASYYFQEYVRQKLMETFSERVEVINFGGQGKDSGWGLTQIPAILRLRPWAATVEFCMNDCADFTLDQCDANLTSIATQLKAEIQPNRVFAMTMNLCIGGTATLPPRNMLSTYHARYRTVAAREGIGLIDNEPLWNLEPTSSWVTNGVENDIHPNPEASRRVNGSNISAALTVV